MTALSLSLWIALGIFLQLAFWLALTFWRHWQRYQAMRLHALDAGVLLQTEAVENGVSAMTVASAWTGWRTFRVQRKEFEDDAQSICSFYLAPEDGRVLPSFLAGRFLTFDLRPTEAGNAEKLIRCYSLSDAPHPDYYRISVKRVLAAGSAHPPGRASGFLHDHVQVGSLLQVRAPSGHFYLQCSSDAPLVLIGGGIGLTPLLSMLEWRLQKQPERELWLFIGVHDGKHLPMKKRLAELAVGYPQLHVWRCFSQPQPDDVLGRDYEHRGRIDLSLLRLHLPLKLFHFYLCGPGAMMGELASSLAAWGVPSSRIHLEAFGPASMPPPLLPLSAESGAAGDIHVTFARSGKTLLWQPSAGSLLALAEAHGIAVSSGCRAGGCGACQTTIVSGEVAYERKPDHDPEPGACLLCVCTPKTSLTLES